jgi:Transmembrane domain of unknown function (DUF3566)
VTHPPDQPGRPQTVTGGGVGASGNGWPGVPAPGQQPGAPVRPRPGQATATSRPASVGAAAPRKGGRRARLVVRRIDPWSTLKFSFIYSLAGLVVLLVAVVALYAIVDAMGVIDSMRTFLNDVEGSKNGSSSVADWLGFGRVMAIALVVGGVNVILFTAFATLTAFIYNVCTDLVGGIEVTLADRS